MHFNSNAATAVVFGLAPLLVRAGDLELDRDDVPVPCSSLCEPVRQLVNICDVDDDRVRDDRTEDLLNLQCVCTNRSFDVARIAGLCQGCMSQNVRSRDNMKDIDEVMRRCGFATQSYAPSQSNAAANATVQATRPTASSQLTTTVAPGGPGQATPTGSGAGVSGNPTGTGGASRPTVPASKGPSTLPQGEILALGAAVLAVFGTVLML